MNKVDAQVFLTIDRVDTQWFIIKDSKSDRIM